MTKNYMLNLSKIPKPCYAIFSHTKVVYRPGIGYIDPVTGDDGYGDYDTVKCFELTGKTFKTLKAALKYREKLARNGGQFTIVQVH